MYSFGAERLYFGCFCNLPCEGAGGYASYFGLVGRHCAAITVFVCGMYVAHRRQNYKSQTEGATELFYNHGDLISALTQGAVYNNTLLVVSLG